MSDEIKETAWNKISSVLGKFLAYLVMVVFAVMTLYPLF